MKIQLRRKHIILSIVVTIFLLVSIFVIHIENKEARNNNLIGIEIESESDYVLILTIIWIKGPMLPLDGLFISILDQNDEKISLEINAKTWGEADINETGDRIALSSGIYNPDTARNETGQIIHEGNEFFYGDSSGNGKLDPGDFMMIYRFADDGHLIDGYTLLILDVDNNVLGSVVL